MRPVLLLAPLLVCGCSLIVEELAPKARDAGARDAAAVDGSSDGAVRVDGGGALAPGAACIDGSACRGGACVDGVCCAAACTETCQACARALTGRPDGECAPITTAGADPRMQCAGNGCGAGTGTCRVADGERCTSDAACRNGMCVAGATCALCAPGAEGYDACWYNPYPQGNTLLDVVAIGGNDFVAVGERGTILRGRTDAMGAPTYRLWQLPSRATLRAVCAVGANELYAVGENRTFVRFDGTAWTDVPVAALTPTTALNDVVCLADGTVLAVGGSALLRRTLAGVIETVPLATSDEARSVWAFNATNAYVGTDVGLQSLNGGTFTVRTVPAVASIDAIFVRGTAASHSVFIVTNDGRNTVLYEGSAGFNWAVRFRTTNSMGSPCGGTGRAVWGSATGRDLYLGYSQGCYGERSELAFTDGTQDTDGVFVWSDVASTRTVATSSLYADHVRGIAGAGGVVVAVGDNGAMSRKATADARFVSSNLAPVLVGTKTLVAGDDARVVGSSAGTQYMTYTHQVVSIAQTVTSALRTGSPPTSPAFTAHALLASGDVLGVRNTGPPAASLLERFTPSTGTFEAPTPVQSGAYGLNSLVAADATHAVAAGSGGIFVLTNVDWVRAGASTNLRALAADPASPRTLRAVGDGGVIFVSTDAMAFAAEISPTTEALLGVWGHTDRWYAVTGDDFLLRPSGGVWARAQLSPSLRYVPSAFAGVRVSATRDDLWVGGATGLLTVYPVTSGAVSAAVVVDLGTARDVSSLASSANGTLWVGLAGPGTAIQRVRGRP